MRSVGEGGGKEPGQGTPPHPHPGVPAQKVTLAADYQMVFDYLNDFYFGMRVSF